MSRIRAWWVARRETRRVTCVTCRDLMLSPHEECEAVEQDWAWAIR